MKFKFEVISYLYDFKRGLHKFDQNHITQLTHMRNGS